MAKSMSFLKKLAISLATILVLTAVFVIPIVVTVTNDNSRATTPTPLQTTTPYNPFDPANLNKTEKARINCYPEAESPFENLTQYACEQIRNCKYSPDVTHPLVPTCYYDAQNLGYKLKNKKSDYEYELTQSGKAPFPGEISNIKLTVEYLGKNMIHVKVSL